MTTSGVSSDQWKLQWRGSFSAAWTTCSGRQLGRLAVDGSLDDLQWTAAWTTCNGRQLGRLAMDGSLDDLQWTAAFVQRTGNNPYE